MGPPPPEAAGNALPRRLPPRPPPSRRKARGSAPTSARAAGEAPPRRWLSALCLGRPRTTIPSLLCFALGHAFTGAGASWRFALAAVLSLLVPFAANLHNAYTDLAEDSRNLPGRRALVRSLGADGTRRLVTALSLGMLAGACLLGLRFALLMALAVIGLHQYSAPPYRTKERPILGLWVFAQVVTFPFLFGWAAEPDRMLRTAYDHFASLLLATEGPAAPLVHHGYRYFAMMLFLTVWFMAKGMVKNVPDFHGDAAAGLRTSATLFGTWRGAARAAACGTIAAYLSLGLLVVGGLESPALLVALVWLAPISWNCRRLVRAEDGRLANRYLRTDMLLTSGFIATLLLLVAPRPASLAVVVAGALILFGSDLLDIDSRRSREAAPPVGLA